MDSLSLPPTRKPGHVPAPARRPRTTHGAPRHGEKARADRTSAELLAEIDGFVASPILSYAPAKTPFTKDREDLVRRWETAKRYYETRIEWDMFDTPILLAANGGKGTNLGLLRVVAAGEQIEQALREIERRRDAHGYMRVA